MTSATKPRNPASRGVVLATTVVLGGISVALIFAPAEVGAALGAVEPGKSTILLQLYGSALFGLAMTGWMVKDAVIGGIFGRSYVVGNTAHAAVGASALLRSAVEPAAAPLLKLLACAYLVLAIVFAYLMFMATPQS